MLPCERRNVRFLGFQLDRIKDSSLIRCDCFLTFIISVNYGAKLDLSPLHCESLHGPTEYDTSKLLFQNSGKRSLATLIGSELNVESELSLILQSKNINALRVDSW